MASLDSSLPLPQPTSVDRVASIDQAILHSRGFFGAPFTVDPRTFEVKTLSLWERLRHWREPKYKTNLNVQTVAALREMIYPFKGKTPTEIGENPTIRMASHFFRSLDKTDSANEQVVQAKKELQAIRLGIPVEVLSRHPDFKKFAEANYLDRYLWKYGHQLVEKNGTIVIRIDSEDYRKDVDWKTIKLDSKGKIQGVYLQSGVYPPVDIGNGKFIDWVELKPFMRRNPADWNFNYVFEFCAWCVEKGPRCEGDHAWLRLYEPNGNIYSVSVYRPGKAPGRSSRCGPLRKQLASLHSPDESDLCPDPTYTTFQAKITREGFNIIKAEIEKYKKQEIAVKKGEGGDLHFQGFVENCTRFCKNMALLANIRIPTAHSYQKVFLPLYLPKVMVWLPEKIYSFMPSVIQKVIDVCAAIIFNTLSLILGAGRVDSGIPNRYKIKPLISSFWDIFDIKKTWIHHPHTMGYETREKVMKWRAEELSKTKYLVDKMHIEYSLPPEFANTPDDM